MNDEPLSIEQIQDGLSDRRLYVVAEATGLSYPTLQKLARGDNANYTRDTLAKVSTYLKTNNQANEI